MNNFLKYLLSSILFFCCALLYFFSGEYNAQQGNKLNAQNLEELSIGDALGNVEKFNEVDVLLGANPVIKRLDGSESGSVVDNNKYSILTNWLGIILDESALYEDLDILFENKSTNLIIENGVAFFKVEYLGNKLFYSITSDEIKKIKENPSALYNEYLNELDEYERFGDWSYNTEVYFRKHLSKAVSTQGYHISAIQCRERLCLAEVFDLGTDSFDQLIQYSLDDSNDCNCIFGGVGEREGSPSIIKFYLKAD
jgi:hypothetical protein